MRFALALAASLVATAAYAQPHSDVLGEVLSHRCLSDQCAQEEVNFDASMSQDWPVPDPRDKATCIGAEQQLGTYIAMTARRLNLKLSYDRSTEVRNQIQREVYFLRWRELRVQELRGNVPECIRLRNKGFQLVNNVLRANGL